MNTPTTSQTASPLTSVKINRMAIRVPGKRGRPDLRDLRVEVKENRADQECVGEKS
jgi:hypothetical protein